MFRFEVDGEEKFRDLVAEKQPVVFAFWHEGLLVLCWYMAELLAIGYRLTFLISPSVDGEFGVEILARFGSTAVRGSARRSGAAALRGLIKTIREDRQSPCITLDGSKGPPRYCKPGAIMVARMADVPIVPIGFAAQKSLAFAVVGPAPRAETSLEGGHHGRGPLHCAARDGQRRRRALAERPRTTSQPVDGGCRKSVRAERRPEKSTD